MHAQLEIWKAAYVDISSNDNGNPLTSVAGPSSAVPTTMSNSLSQTSMWNQMLHDDTDVSDGMLNLHMSCKLLDFKLIKNNILN